jgi:hypothetical protein
MSVIDFVNSPFFGGLIAGVATLATGLIAIWVFKSQKKDEKTNAAVSILFEVRNAESKVEIISEKLNSNSTHDLPRVLPSNNWKKYSHLFAKDFDEDEFKLINTFYNTCEIIEDLVVRQNGYIWIATEERGRVAQQLLGKIHIQFQEESMAGDEATKQAQIKFDRQRSAVTKFFTDEQYFYAPRKTLDGLKFSIDHLQRISATTCGAKLKKLAKV